MLIFLSSHYVGAIDHDMGTIYALKNIGSFFQNIDIVIVIFVLFFVFVAKHNFLLTFINSWLENFIGTLRKPHPLICLLIEVIKSDLRIPIRDTNIVAFVFENS